MFTQQRVNDRATNLMVSWTSRTINTTVIPVYIDAVAYKDHAKLEEFDGIYLKYCGTYTIMHT